MKALGLGAAASAISLALLAGCAVQRPRAYLDALAAGDRAMHAGRFAEAAEAYGRASQGTRRPLDRDEAAYRRAQALRRAGLRAEALAQFDWLAANGQLEAREDRAAYEAARLRYEAGAVERAEADLLELARRAPETGVAPRALELVLRGRDERDPSGALALAWIDRAWPLLGASSLAPRLWMERASRYERAQRWPEALGAYEQLLALGFAQNNHWDDGAVAYVTLLRRLGRHADAAAIAERALVWREGTALPLGSNERPMFARLALLRGAALRDAGRAADAADAYHELYALHPRSRLRDDALRAEAELRAALGERSAECAALQTLARDFFCTRHGRAALESARRCEAEGFRAPAPVGRAGCDVTPRSAARAREARGEDASN